MLTVTAWRHERPRRALAALPPARLLLLLLLLTVLPTLSGCAVIGTVFRAGLLTILIGLLVLIGVIVLLVQMIR